MSADRPGRIRLVGANDLGPSPGPARSQPGHPDSRHDRGELRCVPALPGSQHQRQQPLSLLARQVQLGRQPAAGTSECVIGRLRPYSAGRLGLQITVPGRAGRVLMGPADRGVHADLPADKARGIGQDL